jgi:hypothetical protein
MRESVLFNVSFIVNKAIEDETALIKDSIQKGEKYRSSFRFSSYPEGIGGVSGIVFDYRRREITEVQTLADGRTIRARLVFEYINANLEEGNASDPGYQLALLREVIRWINEPVTRAQCIDEIALDKYFPRALLIPGNSIIN